VFSAFSWDSAAFLQLKLSRCSCLCLTYIYTHSFATYKLKFYNFISYILARFANPVQKIGGRGVSLCTRQFGESEHLHQRSLCFKVHHWRKDYRNCFCRHHRRSSRPFPGIQLHFCSWNILHFLPKVLETQMLLKDIMIDLNMPKFLFKILRFCSEYLPYCQWGISLH